MQRLVAAILLVLLLAGAAVWWARRPREPLEVAYVAERRLTIWSRLSQVREPVALLPYGERVEIVERRDGNVLVRARTGAEGWTESRFLMDGTVWQRVADLREQAGAMPVQARGRTRVISNVRLGPGRAEPRVFQFGRDVPVEVLARAVAEWSPEVGEAAATPAAPESGKPRREDWLLIRGREEQAGDVVGWVLGRFLELELPDPLRDYGAGVRWMAWFELGRVPTEASQRPFYLGVGLTGPEGQACDFALMRVYTWSLTRNRYETSYVESNLCGRLPVRVAPTERFGRDEAAISFVDTSRGREVTREYRMRGNLVRPLRGSR